MNHNFCINGFKGFLIIISCAWVCSADVRVEFPGTFVGTGDWLQGPTPRIYNTTTSRVDLVGWRFMTRDFGWSKLIGFSTCYAKNVDLGGGNILHEGRLGDSAAYMIRSIPYTGETPVTQNLSYNGENVPKGADATPKQAYVLLKTSSRGVPDHPPTEVFLSVAQLDSVIKTANYYTTGYRRKDSLGTGGGRFSGGFVDTWRGETQALLAVPKNTFTVNGSPGANLDLAATNGPIYWMSLAMVQEYLSVDMQWLMAIGCKETFAGVSGPNIKYIGDNSDGAYGCFEIESPTLLSRAIAYPPFFPDYAVKLASLSMADFEKNVITSPNFAAEYLGAGFTQINSAHIVNCALMSSLVFYYIYDLLSFAEDLCWKELLDSCVDHYVGIGAMAPMYNRGIYDTVEKPLLIDNYKSLLNDPNASDKFKAGNSNYRKDVMKYVQEFVNASFQSVTDPTVVLMDTYITYDDVQKFFFGDGGSATAQGKGGLLKHFVVDRPKLAGDLQSAFTKLAAHWNQNPAAISFRYDWITLLRAVKGYFDFSRPKPMDEESAKWISVRSRLAAVKGCDGLPSDREFPFLEIANVTNENNNVVITAKTRDNRSVKELASATGYDWKTWKTGTFVSGSAAEKTYTITIPKSALCAPGLQTQYFWVSVTDSAGNTVVKKYDINNIPVGLKDGCEKALYGTLRIRTTSASGRYAVNIFLPAAFMPVEVSLHNCKGAKIATLHKGTVPDGNRVLSLSFARGKTAAGVYFVTVKCAGLEERAAVLLLR